MRDRKESSMVRVRLCRVQKMQGVFVEKWPSWEDRGWERFDLDDGRHVESSSDGVYCLIVLATKQRIKVSGFFLSVPVR